MLIWNIAKNDLKTKLQGSKMKFTEFTVSTTSEAQELVADILWQYTVYGVAVCDYADVVELVENRRETFDYIEDELLEAKRRGTLVKAYTEISETETVSEKLERDFAELRKNSQGFIDCGTLEVTKRVVDGDDWIEVWRKHFKPIKYGKIVVCPKWIEYKPESGEQVVYIDSNMAFGTGEHETTSMCIELIEEYVTPEMTLLDVGTGSGILGISAVKLGAKKAVMTDIDTVAVLSAKHNAEINNVSEKCEIIKSDLIDGVEGVADIAVANIMAEILVRLAKDIAVQLKKGGILIMSGIIKARIDLVTKAFEAVGFKSVKVVNKGEWYALVMQNMGL